MKMDREEAVILLRSLVTSRKEVYSLRELLRDFEAETGEKLPAFGYKTQLDFLNSIPDTLQISHSNSDVRILPVKSSKSAHIASLVKRQKSSKAKCQKKFCQISKKFFPEVSRNSSKDNDNYYEKQIYQNRSHRENPKGKSPCRDRDDYKLEFKGPTYGVDVTDSDASSGISEPESVTDMKTTIGVIRKFLSEMCEKNEIDESMKDAPACSPVSDLPKIPKLNLKSCAGIGDYLEVCVSEVYSPQKFFLQLRKFKIKLINFMIQMQLFYNRNGDDYIIYSHLHLHEGKVCAALYSTNSECSEWHRAVILKVTENESRVIVQLIDYGTIAEIEKDNLRFLHCQFYDLPAQAFSGNLANIQPCSGEAIWPEKANKRFLELVFDKDLLAGIVDINYEKLWVSVALTYTAEMDLHVSDTLVEEKLASFVNYESPERYDISTNDAQVTYLDVENLIHPSKIMKTRKSRCEKVQPKKPTKKVLSYTVRNDKLAEMFAEKVT